MKVFYIYNSKDALIFQWIQIKTIVLKSDLVEIGLFSHLLLLWYELTYQLQSTSYCIFIISFLLRKNVMSWNEIKKQKKQIIPFKHKNLDSW